MIWPVELPHRFHVPPHPIGFNLAIAVEGKHIMMKSVKYPKWNELQLEEQLPRLTPDTSIDKVSLDHLEIGMMVKASVMGAVIKMRLSEITPPNNIEAEIVRIDNKDDTIDGLYIGDAVFVELHDMTYRKENRITKFSSFFSICVTIPLVEFFEFNCIFDYHCLLSL